MSTLNPKHQLFEALARTAKGIAHPDRLQLIEHLGQREQSVEALAQRVGLSVANASQHLQHLRRIGFVTARRDGKYIFYKLANSDVVELLAALRQVAERGNAEVDRILRGYFFERDSFEPVTREDLLDRYKDGLVTVLDVRPHDEFAAAHVPGAVNIPLDELDSRLAELDPAEEIVAYCRGAYCVFSFEAVAKLRTLGFKARRLEDGLPEWKAAGLPLEIEEANGA